jgi:hypothetical protein
MAHKYSNFASAFANISGIHYSNFQYGIQLAKDDITWALYYNNLKDWQNAIMYAASGVYYCADAIQDFMELTLAIDQSAFFESMYWASQEPAGGDVTWQKIIDAFHVVYPDEDFPIPITWQSIIDAWRYNDYEGDTITIYTLDRMRERIWNRPFCLTDYGKPEDIELPPPPS